jgi:hypothetical protein
MKTATKSVFEFLAGELDGWHSLADVWFGYALSILIGLINRSQRLLARPVPGDFTADHKISTRLAPRRRMKTNIYAPFRIIKAALPHDNWQRRPL